MGRRVLLAIAAIAMAGLAACGGDGGDDDASSGAASGDDPAVTGDPLDQSSFCVAIRALETLGSNKATVAGTPADVLAQNEQLAVLIDEASANAPEDAPADVQSLVDDYGAFVDAVAAAAGDRDVAIAALSAEQPELLARFTQADAHREAFAFFAERCGTAAPP